MPPSAAGTTRLSPRMPTFVMLSLMRMAEDEYHHQCGTRPDSGNPCSVCLRIHDDDIDGDETMESHGTASPAAATNVLWYRLHCDRSHWVCRECFHAWAKQHSGLTTCPLCRCESTEYIYAGDGPGKALRFHSGRAKRPRSFIAHSSRAAGPPPALVARAAFLAAIRRNVVVGPIHQLDPCADRFFNFKIDVVSTVEKRANVSA
jgi:hypothetical protein